ncbi:hypothetical protein E0Z10_g6403 [Xylaria hypoxylon]|uniref:Uncharacterized protein n=1 Tax=Xylaria hypoxylon TaxID=37992 RepID=A0A4Z0YEB9_9PEZI|nr:hypothetical protein E0Z10_g6403 [Xylaria hypoxylon]
MKKQHEILKGYVITPSETEVKDKLLTAGFVVVDKDGTAGRRDFDLSSLVYSPDPVSWLVSMRKLAAAVSVLQVVERGVICSLNDDVSSTLPELAALIVLYMFDDDGKPILEAYERAITYRNWQPDAEQRDEWALVDRWE